MPGPAPEQKYGSCQKNLCDEAGVMTTVDDPTNAFDDGNPCTKHLCTGPDGGVPQNPPNLGVTCMLTTTTMGYCEFDPNPDNPGFPMCSQCDPSIPTSCSGGWSCVGYRCVPPTCTDNAQDFGETDVDCGGPDCLPCKKGFKCLKFSDCFSQVCDATTHTCLAPSCMDNVQNEDETDVDCGGHCKPCLDTNKCRQASDCQSQVCLSGAPGTPDTCAAPTCTDGVQNGGESGVDCGGSVADGGHVCPPC
jgi:hypothetical protein